MKADEIPARTSAIPGIGVSTGPGQRQLTEIFFSLS